MTILEYLQKWCDELSPFEFYRLIFPVGELEQAEVYESGKYNAIAVSIGTDKIKRFTVNDDLRKVSELAKTDDFCIMSPISYAGKSRASRNARFIYALAIDIDGINLEQYKGQPIGMSDMFYQFDGNGPSNYLPKPTAIVSSGTGVHVYYVFEKPIPCFPNIIEQLSVLKNRLTWQYWTQGLTTLPNAVQYESLFQGFRMPGTITKKGTRAKAFLIDGGKKVSVEYLNNFVPEEYRCNNFAYKSNLTLAQAKKKYPEWYDRRIVKGEKKGRWTVKRDLYDWWLREIKAKAKLGGRYWAVQALATFAVKCNIGFDELQKNAIELVPILDELTEQEDNHFTKDDVLHALEAYNEDYVTYPRKIIAERTMIPIPQNKRNGRKQEKHLQLARGIRELKGNMGEKVSGGGRPKGSGTAEHKVKEWQKMYPEGSKSACKADTGLSYPTIRKWWS